MRRIYLALMLLAFTPMAFAQAQEFRYARPLYIGMSGTDVKALQEALKAIPDTFTEEATGYFGKITEAAVKRFQEREGVARSGMAGYGQVGPKTATKIRELLGKRESVSVSGAQTPTPNTSVQTSRPVAAAPTPPARDTTPPLRFGGSPSNVVPVGTTSVMISLSTDEPARCYFSETRNTQYEYMSSLLTPTMGGKQHTYTLAPRAIVPGNYTFFVKCRDPALNANKSDYPILFWIEYGELEGDRHSPSVFMSAPTDGDSLAEGLIILSAAASDNLGVTGVRFFLNGQDLNFEDPSAPFSVAVMLVPGTYSAFAVARDLAGNRATSTEVSFTITPKAAAKNSFGAPLRHATLDRNLAAALGPLLGVGDLLAALLGHLFR